MTQEIKILKDEIRRGDKIIVSVDGSGEIKIVI